MSFTCLDVALAAKLRAGRKVGKESSFICSRHDDHDPSLLVNDPDNVWMCGPCGKGGNAYQLAAFLASVDPDDKSKVLDWLREHGLTNGNGRRPDRPARWQQHPIKCWYDYTDPLGNLYYSVARVEYIKDNGERKKEFPVWCKGSWGLKDKGVEKVPYRLHKLLAPQSIDVAVCEGEQDVETLESLGFIATCNAGGAGKFTPELAKWFRKDQHIDVYEDNDAAGRDHVQQVASVLYDKVASVKLIRLPGLPEKGDVTDWVQGKDREAAAEELARMTEAAPAWQPLTPQMEEGVFGHVEVAEMAAPGESEASYIEFAPAFLAVEDPPMRYLIDELLPEEIIALTHGEPRTRKSWAALEIAIALTTGRPAFGLDRFRVRETVPVLYCSQEDGARPVRQRMKRLLRGYSLPFPEKLAFAVHKGIDLENPVWQESLLRDVKRIGFRALVFDPVRRFSDNADKGPAEVRKITGFLRELVVRTGASIIINHHDVKPSGDKPDTRRRSHKASGGDWFAASECPIAFEPAGENCSLVIPEDYKFSIDPKPFTFRIEEDPERTQWARLVGEDSSAEQAGDMVAQGKIVTFLQEQPGKSGSAIAKGVRMGKAAVLQVLSDLEKAGRVDSVKPEKNGKGAAWFIRKDSE